MKFDVLARFRETIPTIKSVSSSEIQIINFGFLIEITILPFLRKLDFIGSYRITICEGGRKVVNKEIQSILDFMNSTLYRFDA